MQRIDRYITSEFVPLLAFGIGAFLVILVGVELLPQALKMAVREGFPLSLVITVFLYRLPGIVALTLPMAVMFASLMATANLSSHGELLAMKAAGIPFVRVVIAIIAGGLFISILTLLFNESVSPRTNRFAEQLIQDYRSKGKPIEGFEFQVPDSGRPREIFRVSVFDPAKLRAEDILILKFRENGNIELLMQAMWAKWEGEEWILHDGKRISIDERGRQRETTFDTITINIGRTAQDFIKTGKYDLEELTLGEIQSLLEHRRAQNLPYNPDLSELIQAIQTRLALPWCALGFAILGVALGQRPVRTSASVGFGLSLVVVFLYYLVFNVLTLTGEQGGIPPLLTAWVPNIALFAVGIALLRRART